MRFLYAMVGHMGMPSFLFTFAPDDIFGSLNICLSMPQKDNVQFPTNDDGLIEALRSDQSVCQGINIKRANLKALVAGDPVATAEVYRLMMRAIYKVCLGMEPEEKTRRSNPTKKRGIIGKIHGAFGVNESQARGALHMHLLIWGGLPPSLLQYGGSTERLKRAIVKQINLMLRAYLSPESHVNSMLDELRSFQRPRSVLFPCANPVSHPESFNKDTERIAVSTNFHRHSQTCHKGNIGKLFCRLGLPRQLLEETGVEYLVPRRDPVTNKITYDTLDESLPPSSSSLPMRNFSNDPIRKRNSNIAYWDVERPSMKFPDFMDIEKLDEEFATTLPDFPPENADADYAERIREIADRFCAHLSPQQSQDEWLRLKNELEKLSRDEWRRLSRAFPTRNGLIVEYSPVVTAVLGCNTNLSFLGSEAQAKATICYVLKYITKPPAELSHTLALLYRARQTVQSFPSVAPDSGQPMRTAQHYLNRIVNQTTSAQEVSAEMAAAALLGMTSEVCTHGFITLHASAAIGYGLKYPISEPAGVETNFETSTAKKIKMPSI